MELKFLRNVYDHAYWDALPTGEWSAWKQAEDYHRAWKESAEQTGGELTDKAWVEYAPNELKEILSDKLADLQLQARNMEAYSNELRVWTPITPGEWESWLTVGIGASECQQDIERELPRMKSLGRTLGLFKTGGNQGPDIHAKIEAARQVATEELLAGLKRSGRSRVCPCPFHRDKTPSFTLYPDGSYRCFSCLKHGKDAISLAMSLYELTFLAAVEYLAGGSR